MNATTGCSSRALCVAVRWRKIVVLNTATCVTRADAIRHQASCRSTRQPTTSPVALFEVLHESGERVDARFRERVVDRRADAADGSVPLEPIQPGLFGVLDELFLQLFIRQPERHIHQRPAVFLRSTAIKTGSIDLRVQLAGLARV